MRTAVRRLWGQVSGTPTGVAGPVEPARQIAHFPAAGEESSGTHTCLLQHRTDRSLGRTVTQGWCSRTPSNPGETPGLDVWFHLFSRDFAFLSPIRACTTAAHRPSRGRAVAVGVTVRAGKCERFPVVFVTRPISTGSGAIRCSHQVASGAQSTGSGTPRLGSSGRSRRSRSGSKTAPTCFFRSRRWRCATRFARPQALRFPHWHCSTCCTVAIRWKPGFFPTARLASVVFIA